MYNLRRKYIVKDLKTNKVVFESFFSQKVYIFKTNYENRHKTLCLINEYKTNESLGGNKNEI